MWIINGNHQLYAVIFYGVDRFFWSRTGNGAGSERERPMSWEGELSDQDIDDDADAGSRMLKNDAQHHAEHPDDNDCRLAPFSFPSVPLISV